MVVKKLNLHSDFNIGRFERSIDYQFRIRLDLPSEIKDYFPCISFGTLFSDTLVYKN